MYYQYVKEKVTSVVIMKTIFISIQSSSSFMFDFSYLLVRNDVRLVRFDEFDAEFERGRSFNPKANKLINVTCYLCNN